MTTTNDDTTRQQAAERRYLAIEHEFERDAAALLDAYHEKYAIADPADVQAFRRVVLNVLMRQSARFSGVVLGGERDPDVVRSGILQGILAWATYVRSFGEPVH